MTTLYHGVATVEDTTDRAMTTLYHQWYNAVIGGLRLDRNTFQLLQPATPLNGSVEQLWTFFNTVPPYSLVSNMQLNGLHRFYDEYRAVVSSLISHPGDPISLAQQSLNYQFGFVHGVPNFGATIQDLREALVHAPSRSFAFNSATQNADTSNTWAKDAVGGIWNFFEADGDGPWAATQAKAAAGQVVVSLSLDHMLCYAATPASWDNLAALAAAYAIRDERMWPGIPNWNTVFGPTGTLQRFLTEVVVVDGINMSMTSAADYDVVEQEEIMARADEGFFPFFCASEPGGFSSSISFDTRGTMTVTAASPIGHPLILGAVVTPASTLLSGHMTRRR
jgi:hypothetical protein